MSIHLLTRKAKAMNVNQANELMNYLGDFCDDILNKTFDKHYKESLLIGAQRRLNSVVNQDNPQQPQPDPNEPKKVKGEEITPKGLNPNENK